MKTKRLITDKSLWHGRSNSFSNKIKGRFYEDKSMKKALIHKQSESSHLLSDKYKNEQHALLTKLYQMRLKEIYNKKRMQTIERNKRAVQDRIRHAAICIQKYVRGFLVRKNKYILNAHKTKLRNNILELETLFKNYYLGEKEAFVIQKYYKGYKTRLQFKILRNACISIQSAYRRYETNQQIILDKLKWIRFKLFWISTKYCWKVIRKRYKMKDKKLYKKMITESVIEKITEKSLEISQIFQGSSSLTKNPPQSPKEKLQDQLPVRLESLPSVNSDASRKQYSAKPPLPSHQQNPTPDNTTQISQSINKLPIKPLFQKRMSDVKERAFTSRKQTITPPQVKPRTQTARSHTPILQSSNLLKPTQTFLSRTKLNQNSPLKTKIGPMVRGRRYQKDTRSREIYQNELVKPVLRQNPLPARPVSYDLRVKLQKNSYSQREIKDTFTKQEENNYDDHLVEKIDLVQREFIYRTPSKAEISFKCALPELYTILKANRKNNK